MIHDMNLLTIGATLARRGMLTPGPPVQQVKQLTALKDRKSVV